MRLFYITRVNIPSSAAQSVQISSMCESFGKQNIEFKLVSTLSKENLCLQKSFVWDKIELKMRFRYLEFVIKSFLKVLKEKPTHVYTRDIGVAFALCFFKVKIIYEAHKEPKSKIPDFMIKVLKNKNNFRLVAISSALKEFYKKHYGFSVNKMLACHDGVFIDSYDQLRNSSKGRLRKELNLPISKLIIMHTGSLYKGDDAKLFKVIVDNFKDILFVQVGGSEQDIHQYKEYYRENKNIIFVGHQTHEDIVKYQMSADLLFYALTKSNKLWWCTSPLKVFEYMATGIPILGSNIGSVGEVLTDANSIVFDPEDESTMIKGFHTFLSNKELVQKISEQALADIRSVYTWEMRVSSILSFMKDDHV